MGSKNNFIITLFYIKNEFCASNCWIIITLFYLYFSENKDKKRTKKYVRICGHICENNPPRWKEEKFREWVQNNNNNNNNNFTVTKNNNKGNRANEGERRRTEEESETKKKKRVSAENPRNKTWRKN